MPTTLHDHYVRLVKDVLDESVQYGFNGDVTAEAILDVLGLGPDPFTEQLLAAQ